MVGSMRLAAWGGGSGFDIPKRLLAVCSGLHVPRIGRLRKCPQPIEVSRCCGFFSFGTRGAESQTTSRQMWTAVRVSVSPATRFVKQYPAEPGFQEEV